MDPLTFGMLLRRWRARWGEDVRRSASQSKTGERGNSNATNTANRWMNWSGARRPRLAPSATDGIFADSWAAVGNRLVRRKQMFRARVVWLTASVTPRIVHCAAPRSMRFLFEPSLVNDEFGD